MENNTEALVISKRFKLPKDHRTDISFLAPLIEYISSDLKVLLIAQKVFSLHLGGNPRWVPLLIPGYRTKTNWPWWIPSFNYYESPGKIN